MIKCEYSTRLIKKIKSLDNDHMIDLPMIYKAIGLAQKYHAGQFRKTGEVFYSHPLEVAYRISKYLLKTDVLITSILHDIVEDTEVTVEMISTAFNPRIAQMVDRLTRDRPDGSKLTVDEILNNAYQHQDKEVLLIKCFDRLHNMETLQVMTQAKRIKIANKTFEIFIVFAIYIQNKDLEQKLYKRCCKILSVPSNIEELTDISENSSDYI